MSEENPVSGRIDYRSSGVDIGEGDKAVRDIRSIVRKTYDSRVLSDTGSFGGLFLADFNRFRNPVLVASTDGVGTKLKVASIAGDYSTVGMDLINHCINDILVQGAEPLFFQDYIACGKLETSVTTQIISGMAAACVENSCVLLGGEIAEMPGFYSPGDYDVAGTVIGIVEREKIIDGSTIKAGNIILTLPSTGLHTNGYSLARKVLFDTAGLGIDDEPEGLNTGIRKALLAVHRSYLNAVKPLLEKDLVKGLCHITGGGIPGNLNRILPASTGAEIKEIWPVPAIFDLIRRLGRVSDSEMRKAFNMGAGMLLVIAQSDVEEVESILENSGEQVFSIGRITETKGIKYI